MDGNVDVVSQATLFDIFQKLENSMGQSYMPDEPRLCSALAPHQPVFVAIQPLTTGATVARTIRVNATARCRDCLRETVSESEFATAAIGTHAGTEKLFRSLRGVSAQYPELTAHGPT